MSRIVVVAALAAALGVGVAAGQTKPDYKDLKSIEAWMAEQKIDQGGTTRYDKTWVIIGSAPEGVYLSRRLLDSNHNRGGKFTIVVNRLELFEPIVDGTRVIMSIQFDHEVDCLHRTSRRTVLTSYSKHNLVSKPVTERIREPFAPFDAMMKPIADDICRAIEG